MDVKINDNQFQVQVVDNHLVISAPIQRETSKSGKSTLLVSSGGNVATGCVIDGKPVVVGLNAYIPR